MKPFNIPTCNNVIECCFFSIPDITKIKDYIDSFKFGAPPHAGGGIGMCMCISTKFLVFEQTQLT